MQLDTDRIILSASKLFLTTQARLSLSKTRARELDRSILSRSVNRSTAPTVRGSATQAALALAFIFAALSLWPTAARSRSRASSAKVLALLCKCFKGQPRMTQINAVPPHGDAARVSD